MNHLRKTTDGTWEVRIVVPPEVRGVIGKNNLTKRLGRLTKSEANNRAAPVIAEFQARIAAARAGDAPPLNLPERSSAPIEQPFVPYVSLRGLYEGYLSERKPAAATAKRFRGVIERFIRDVGHDNAARITAQDVVIWKTTLLQTLSGKTVKEVYLSALNVVLRWGKNNLKIPSNPADGITVLVPKTKFLRSRRFTSDEAQKILHASLTNWFDDIPPHYQRARRWIPWICAYSGARINEVTQMRGCDVFERDGCLVMNITPEAGTVKNGKARLVPVHEDLRNQGFLLAVRSVGDGPLFYDPTETRKHEDVKYTLWEKTATHLRDFIHELIDDLEVAPNHAWRHTFMTIAREAGLETPFLDYIVSFSRKSQGDEYGDWTNKANARQMAKFPRYILRDEAASE